jgi:hypothetical protein
LINLLLLSKNLSCSGTWQVFFYIPLNIFELIAENCCTNEEPSITKGVTVMVSRTVYIGQKAFLATRLSQLVIRTDSGEHRRKHGKSAQSKTFKKTN